MEAQDLDRMIRERGFVIPGFSPRWDAQSVYMDDTSTVITGITAYGVASSPSLMMTIYTNKILMWGLIIAEFALVFGATAAINRLHSPLPP